MYFVVARRQLPNWLDPPHCFCSCNKNQVSGFMVALIHVVIALEIELVDLLSH
jgi:hypothetical protein